MKLLLIFLLNRVKATRIIIFTKDIKGIVSLGFVLFLLLKSGIINHKNT